MEWKTLTKQEARRRVAEWRSPEAIECAVKDLDAGTSGGLNETYCGLRKDLVNSFRQIRSGIAADRLKNADYVLDLDFGLCLYQRLDALGFSPRTASHDGVWVYLSVVVVPDLVFERYGRISEDRYYAKTRRIWLKAIWWYIYLSLQKGTDGHDDLQRTREILLHNSTDTILQVVDRAGPGGYRVGFTRELMRRYGEMEPPDSNGKLLRRIMMLHVARVRFMEPSLADGGVEGYVDSLLSFFDE